MRFALVAGEASGDILGAALIRALSARFPQATFYGVAGPRMREAGCEAVETIDALSVMGLAEVIPALPRLFKLRARLEERFAADRPDAFIGIDAPDFNLSLEKRLRARGVRTVHFVSPTIWAWRPNRIHGIGRAVDLMLCMYPFEPEIYAQHGLAAAYVGHPLADELDDRTPADVARRALGLPLDGPVVAVLPGSRGAELHKLAAPFAGAAAWLAQRWPGVRFVVPIARPDLKPIFEAAITRTAGLPPPWLLLDGQSRTAMQAADAVLLASGTATLECLLLGRPMVVAYKAAPLTAFILKRFGLLKIERVSQPNILSPTPVVPELLQDAATPARLGQELYMLLRHRVLRERQLEQFDHVRRTLKSDFAARAAEAIGEFLGNGADGTKARMPAPARGGAV
jgi:lipid-A-disaccharide synthase